MNKSSKSLQVKKKNKITGITFGAFDFVHAGHCLMFAECKKQCDYLMVGLHVDPSKERKHKNKPIMTTAERYTMLASNKHIDNIFFYNTESELVEKLKELKPDIRFLGEDWKDKEYTGKGMKGIKIVFTPRKHSYSSSELRKRILVQSIKKFFNGLF